MKSWYIGHMTAKNVANALSQADKENVTDPIQVLMFLLTKLSLDEFSIWNSNFKIYSQKYMYRLAHLRQSFAMSPFCILVEIWFSRFSLNECVQYVLYVYVRMRVKPTKNQCTKCNNILNFCFATNSIKFSRWSDQFNVLPENIKC